jgi:hypothetical protein
LTPDVRGRRIIGMFATIGALLRFLRRQWGSAVAMDRRLDAAKHDPALNKEADYEKLKENGRITPWWFT